MPLRRCQRRTLLAAAIAGMLAVVLVPAGPAAAAAGSDNFQDAPALLFSVPGSVANTQPYTTQGGSEPAVSTGTPAPACPAMFHTAWWVITGTGQGIALTTAGSTFNTTLALYDHGGPGGFPLASNRKACDEDSGPGVLSALTFESVRGRQYLVQVGGSLSSEFGAVALAASTLVRPANDDRIAAQTLQTAASVTVPNAGASQELGETLACATAPYAATMWFQWTAPAVGDVQFSTAATFDTAVAVYRVSDGGLVGCSTGAGAKLALRTTSGGTYLVQVASKGADSVALSTGTITTKADFVVDPDVDKDGELASTDCDDNNPAIRHGVVDIPDDGIDQDCSGADAVNLDRDGDGENRPDDCNDGDPAIKHAATDIPGNAIDEDCSGSPAPFPRLESTVRTKWSFKPFRLTNLVIVRAVPGSSVEILCAGGKAKGCPFKRSVVKVTKASTSLPVLSRKLRKAPLTRGAVVEVRVTMAGHVGFMRRHTIRAGATGKTDPKLDEFCLPVGGGKPTPC